MQRKAKLEEAGENKLDTKPKGYFPTAFSDDTGSNNSGLYELKVGNRHLTYLYKQEKLGKKK
jgi:hypothetical protein